jgi:TctA family transporter
MSAFLSLLAIFTGSLALGVVANAKMPCDRIKQQLSIDRQKFLQTSVAKQLNASTVELLAAFASGGWSVLYVDTHQSDEVFLFYSTDPANTSFLNMWSGAAMRNEAPAIESWAIKSTPGIPKALAGCFAWYATAGR